MTLNKKLKLFVSIGFQIIEISLYFGQKLKLFNSIFNSRWWWWWNAFMIMYKLIIVGSCWLFAFGAAVVLLKFQARGEANAVSLGTLLLPRIVRLLSTKLWTHTLLP